MLLNNLVIFWWIKGIQTLFQFPGFNQYNISYKNQKNDVVANTKEVGYCVTLRVVPQNY